MKKPLKVFIEELSKVLVENPNADVVSRNSEPGCGECGVGPWETFEAPDVQISELLIVEEKGTEYGYESSMYSWRRNPKPRTRAVVVIGG